MRRSVTLCLGIIGCLLIAGCGSPASPTPDIQAAVEAAIRATQTAAPPAVPTSTPTPSPTTAQEPATAPEPTSTPEATATPEPTNTPTPTPAPTDTPIPTSTPRPTNTPTPTPQPTNTPVPQPLTLFVDAENYGFVGVNIRAKPSRNAQTLTDASNGERLTEQRKPITDANGETWMQVNYKGTKGYTLGALLSRRKPQPALSFSGSGSDVTRRFTLPSTASTVSFEHSGESNIIVYAYGPNDEEELVVNEIGQSSGTDLLLVENKAGWFLGVEADGAWSIRIRPVEEGIAPISALRGTGTVVSDAFQPVEQGPIPYLFKHQGEGNFIVYLICEGGESLAANEIGHVDIASVVDFEEGPCLWQVEAEGEWSFQPR